MPQSFLRAGAHPAGRPSSSYQKGDVYFDKWITHSVASGSTPDVMFISHDMVLEQLLSALPSSTEKVCHCYSRSSMQPDIFQVVSLPPYSTSPDVCSNEQWLLGLSWHLFSRKARCHFKRPWKSRVLCLKPGVWKFAASVRVRPLPPVHALLVLLPLF